MSETLYFYDFAEARAELERKAVARRELRAARAAARLEQKKAKLRAKLTARARRAAAR